MAAFLVHIIVVAAFCFCSDKGTQTTNEETGLESPEYTEECVKRRTAHVLCGEKISSYRSHISLSLNRILGNAGRYEVLQLLVHELLRIRLGTLDFREVIGEGQFLLSFTMLCFYCEF